MPRFTRAGFAAVASLAVPPALYLLVDAILGGTYAHPTLHVLVMSGASVAAAAAAFAITVAAHRRNDLRAGLVGVGFTAMAGLLVIHGLATPGFLLALTEPNATIGLAGALAVPAGGVLLAAAVFAPAAPRIARRLILWSQASTIGVLVVFGAIGLVHPALVPQVPLKLEPWVFVLLAPVSGVYLWMARRAFHTYRLTGRRADLSVAVGLVLLGWSLVLYLLSDVWTPGFWGGHLLESLGFLAVSGAVAVDLARQVPSHVLHRRLTGADLIEEEESLLGGYVRALTASMELRDPSTREHSRRVARLAVRVGERMGLGPEAQRRLAIAGLLHDIGKLQVPESILRKPGPLTDEEFAIVKTHPVRGAELLAHLGGFDAEVPAVLAHHERFGGGGYPHGIAGTDIPLEARILMVCDVYDALTSRRAYREAWDAGRARACLEEEAGTAFDPACAQALLAVLSAEQSGEVVVLRSTVGHRPAAETA
jgi:putative nucleotidyltransferase with HDIG domain